MSKSRIVSRIWSDLTTLALPPIAVVAYVLEPSSTAATVLLVLALAGMLGPWIADRGWRRWRDALVRLQVRLRRARRRRPRS
jgi:hypothetical protein